MKWTPKEEEVLFGLAGDKPWTIVVRNYNQWAKAEGFPARTRRALTRRVHINGYSIRCTGQWLDTATIAQLLKLQPETIRSWHRKGIVHVFLQGRKKYVSRKSLQDLSKRRPDLFAGCSRNNLFLLLEDETMAEQLAKLKPRLCNGMKAKVRCIETGLIYPSFASAAKSQWVTRSAITHATRCGTKCNGYHWQRIG